MSGIRDMSSKYNTLDGLKERFKKGILEPYKKFLKDNDIYAFNKTSYQICTTEGPATPRWGLVSRKNLFGLDAGIDYQNNNKLVITLNAGRFRIECLPVGFRNKFDISDILDRSEEEQFTEVEQFFDMNNRQAFEKFGVRPNNADEMSFVANCVLLDSLLEGRYSELEEIDCNNKTRTNY